MSQINDGGPAFPHLEVTSTGSPYQDHLGMSLRVYAAIKLRVPSSRIDWLDEMITQSNRDYLAGQALCGLIAGALTNAARLGNVCVYAGKAYELADAMLKQRTKNTETK